MCPVRRLVAGERQGSLYGPLATAEASARGTECQRSGLRAGRLHPTCARRGRVGSAGSRVLGKLVAIGSLPRNIVVLDRLAYVERSQSDGQRRWSRCSR